MTTRIARLAPLSGIAFVAAMVGVIGIEGEEVPVGRHRHKRCWRTGPTAATGDWC